MRNVTFVTRVVNVLTHFGGGGHKYAAGGYSNDTLDVTIDRFKTFLVEIIE